MNSTDTPRTDAMYEVHTSEYQRRLLSEDLERKLSAEIANRKKCCLDGNRISDELFDTQLKLKKSQAEVESLREYYSRFILVSPIEAGRIEKMEDEVKEIRAALGDDGRRTHKELLELATKASQWREWKEKYIDLRNAHIAEGQDPAGTIWEHADKLQKKLKELEAEVERLKKMVIEAAELGDKRSENFKARAEKAEASLIKINEELCHAGLREYGN